MNKRTAVKAALLAVLVVNGMAVAAPPDSKNFEAPLSGREEVPAVDTNAAGDTVLRLNDEGTEIDFRLMVANIDDVTQAHIHCGSAGVNGPVVAFLFGFADPAVTINGILSEGTITDGNVIPRPDSEACPGGVGDLDDLIAKMRSGGAYVNVHTVEHPGGEIRGQIREAGSS